MEITRLTPRHLSDYRALMLQAYAEPGNFACTVSEGEARPLALWQARISDAPEAKVMVLGAFEARRLIGVAGLRFGSRPRTRHKATLFGMHVRGDWRNRGIGRALVAAALATLRDLPEIRVVGLTVFESNLPAIGLYESCGFQSFGEEPWAIDDGERLTSLVHMARKLES